LILSAAKDMFAETGYAGTSTRAIARRCGVVEPSIFRHFGSKAGLFDAAIRVPFDEFLAEYAGAWDAGSSNVDDVSDRSGFYLAGLYERLLANRKLLLALMRAAQEDEAELETLLSGSGSPLDRYFTQIESLASRSMERMGWTSVDVYIAVRATFAMVIGMAMCDEWMFPTDREHPDRTRIVSEMQQFMVHGLAHRG
jgi:AcrR family transcriptional regulator